MTEAPNDGGTRRHVSPSLLTVLREWGRIGCIGFGGPPTHIRLLRELCVERQASMSPAEFEDAIAACNLLPGPASTQLAIFCAWRIHGCRGALVGGLAFIVPGLVLILVLSTLFLTRAPPQWIVGAGAGAGAAVAAVAVSAGRSLVAPSWARRQSRCRWAGYLAAGALATATLGPFIAVVLLACGMIELSIRHAASPGSSRLRSVVLLTGLTTASHDAGALFNVGWVAFKVGALAYGGGFVIIPLMQNDAVDHFHWMSGAQFLNAVALGQVTPGPVVQTVAAVGYAAAGLGGGLIAAAIVFLPSFAFVLIGARHFDRLRGDARAIAFLGGSGPAAIGAIFGSAIPLARALTEPWQYVVLAAALVALIAVHRGAVSVLIAAGVIGVIVASSGGPLPH